MVHHHHDNTGPKNRMKDTTVVKPIVVGNIAKHFGKKREEDGHTHQWTVYLKPFNNEDMSYVKKVVFKLHESFAESSRSVEEAPFEVTESGWGEFEIIIRIHFVDPQEKPVIIYHPLRLFASPAQMATPAVVAPQVISERYDELIFHEPSPILYTALTSCKPMLPGIPWTHDTDFLEIGKAQQISIIAAQKKVRTEIEKLKEQIKTAQNQLKPSSSITP